MSGQPGHEHTRFITPKWAAPKQVRAIFTTRHGGCSREPYDSFNLASHVGDITENVEQNRTRLRQTLALAEAPAWLEQIHGHRVLDLDASAAEDRQADAAFTRSLNRACAVLVADCIPLLLCDEGGTQVAAVHAGWRGLATGIIAAAVSSFDAQASALHAWIGPHISAGKYEVGDEFVTQLEADFPHISDFVVSDLQPTHLDLGAWCAVQLQDCGVHNIGRSANCVYTEKDRFFSYRRSGDTGRMAALIWITSDTASNTTG